MNVDRALRITVIVINSLGLLGFLAWLIWSRERIFYTQDGVLFFLPVLPFFFVYFFVFRSPPPEEDTDFDETE